MGSQSGRARIAPVWILAALVLVLAGGVTIYAVAGPSEPSRSYRVPDGLTRARKLLDEGKIAEAREIFLAELKRDPKNVEAVKGLAFAARDAGDDEEAAKEFRRWTELEPKSALAWKHLAITLARLGRDMEALTAAQTALSLSPEGDPVLSQLVTKLVMGTDPSRDSLGGGRPPMGARGPASPEDPTGAIQLPQVPDPLKDLPRPGGKKK